MIKFLHTADIHLGAKFLSLGDKGKLQREQIKNSFKNLVSQAITERVNIVLIAGDLFDSNQQPQANIDLAIEQFNLLERSNVPVCLISGTHDCFDSTSIYRKVNFQSKCSNLTIFTGEGWNYKQFPELNLTVYGKPNFSNRSYSSPLQGLKRLTGSQHHVAMAHGSLGIPGKSSEDDHIFSTEQIADSQMHYIALGHWHRPYQCSNKEVIAWYSGPPEVIATDQRQPGSILIVTIPDSGALKVETFITGIRYCDEIEIDMSSLNDMLALKHRITEGANSNLIRKVILKGLRNEDLHPSITELETELSEYFFHMKIEDESHPKLTEFSEDTSENKLIITRFMQLMKQHIETCKDAEREIAEDALQYGLALLQGKDII